MLLFIPCRAPDPNDQERSRTGRDETRWWPRHLPSRTSVARSAPGQGPSPGSETRHHHRADAPRHEPSEGLEARQEHPHPLLVLARRYRRSPWSDLQCRRSTRRPLRRRRRLPCGQLQHTVVWAIICGLGTTCPVLAYDIDAARGGVCQPSAQSASTTGRTRAAALKLDTVISGLSGSKWQFANAPKRARALQWCMLGHRERHRGGFSQREAWRPIALSRRRTLRGRGTRPGQAPRLPSEARVSPCWTEPARQRARRLSGQSWVGRQAQRVPHSRGSRARVGPRPIDRVPPIRSRSRP